MGRPVAAPVPRSSDGQGRPAPEARARADQPDPSPRPLVGDGIIARTNPHICPAVRRCYPPGCTPIVALLGRYPHPPVCGSIGLAIRILAARLLKLQSPNGIVSSTRSCPPRTPREASPACSRRSCSWPWLKGPAEEAHNLLGGQHRVDANLPHQDYDELSGIVALALRPTV